MAALRSKIGHCKTWRKSGRRIDLDTFRVCRRNPLRGKERERMGIEPTEPDAARFHWF